jgi:hypothetical protein
MTKEEKREYDKEYRRKNKEKIRLKKFKYYQENRKEIYTRQKARKDNDESRAKHAEYCRKPEQRAKEKERRHIREGKTGTKQCLDCLEHKNVLEFEHWSICEDDRHYLCKKCEKRHQKELGCTTRGVVTAILMRRYSNLTRRDIAKHPYLIEANKYLILLKQLTK